MKTKSIFLSMLFAATSFAILSGCSGKKEYEGWPDVKRKRDNVFVGCGNLEIVSLMDYRLIIAAGCGHMAVAWRKVTFPGAAICF